MISATAATRQLICSFFASCRRISSGMYKRRVLIIIFTATLIVSGCASLLPRSKSVTNSPWKTYKGVVNAYNKVVPHKSTVAEIKKLGFDIYSTSNLKVLSYVDIAVATSSLKREGLGNGIEACLLVRDMCTGYVFEPQVANSNRYGNFWLDTFNFRRKTKESGWKFRASFLIVDDVVVEKFWYGEPVVDRDKEVVNPLGPFQDIGTIISAPKVEL